MGLLRMQAIEDSGLDAKVTIADRLLLAHIARLNNDYKPASDPFRVTLARLIDATKLNAGHIKRRLYALDEKDTIRLARSERRYKPEYDITIIAPDYINALELLVRERNTKHSNENGQHDPLTLVTAQGARSHGTAQGARSQNGTAQGARSHSIKKDLRSKDLPLNKAPAAGDPKPSQEFVDSGQVNSDKNGNSADPEITTDPPAPQTNQAILRENGRLHGIIDHPRSTPAEIDDAKAQLRRLQGRKTVWERARESDPEPTAEPSPLDNEPQPQKERQNARLTELIETKAQSRQESNQKIRDIKAEIDEIKAEQLPAADEADRIDALIAARIATLDPEAEPEQTETQPDSFRQAKDTEIEYPQAKIVHRNRSRKRRKPERNAVHPWTPAQAQAAPVPPQPRQHAQG